MTLTYKTEGFEGPLDLLLQLISKNKVNIYDIPISLILEQYLEQIALMKDKNLEVTADFLAMASQLLFIKSKMLLPKHEDENEEDPREQLVRLLLEYKKYKALVDDFFVKKNLFNKTFVKLPLQIETDNTYTQIHNVDELYDAYNQTLKRIKRKLPPPVTSFSGIVGKTVVSVGSKVIFILRNLLLNKKADFLSLFYKAKNRSEIVATFLAVLELAKSKHIELKEDEKGNTLLKILKTKRKENEHT